MIFSEDQFQGARELKYIGRILIFIVAFAIGSAIVLPPMPEIEPISDELTIACNLDLEGPLAVAAKPSLTIRIRRYDPQFEIEERSIYIDPNAKATSTDIDLDLSESIENQLIILDPASDNSKEYRIEQQFETSMALGDEGPHYDLDHWKHYTSPWQEIENEDQNRFVTRNIAVSDLVKFPKPRSLTFSERTEPTAAGSNLPALARTPTPAPAIPQQAASASEYPSKKTAS